MEKKTIVHIVSKIGLDGTSKVVLEICTSFKYEFEFHIITLKHNQSLPSLNVVPPWVKVHQFDIEENLDYSLVGYLRNLIDKEKWRVKYKSLIDNIISIRPDILHCHVHPRDLMIINSSIRLLDCGLLYTDHSVRIKETEYSFFNRKALSWVFKKMYQNFNVVAVSESIFDYHKRFNIISKRKFHWQVSNRVDTDVFIPLATKRSSPIRVIYVARLHKKKGHDTLIKAWSLLKLDLSCELVLVGGGEEEPALRKAVEAEKCYYPVRFIGDSRDVLSYVQSSHIAVFPSLNEGLPLSLLEKMSCGLPVIVSDIPEFKSLIQEQYNGLFFEVGNPQHLAEKIELLLRDADMRDNLGSHARQFVLENYSLKAGRETYADIYRKLSLTSIRY